jgi:hypothetical protein
LLQKDLYGEFLLANKAIELLLFAGMTRNKRHEQMKEKIEKEIANNNTEKVNWQQRARDIQNMIPRYFL